MTKQRLPWQPHPEGGFVAYPEGWREKPERFARMQPTVSGGYGVYSWSVHYDGQAVSDVSDDKQRASDAANAAWPRVIAMAEAAGAKTEWERQTLEMIEKAERGEIEPDFFAGEAATYENMMWVMDKIKPRSDGARVIPATLQRVVDAISAEFFRRRRK